MTINELAEKLANMYETAPTGDSVAMIHLFGIRYSNEIKDLGVSSKALAKAAKLNDSYGTEISKGVKLAKYVTPKSRT